MRRNQLSNNPEIRIKVKDAIELITEMFKQKNVVIMKHKLLRKDFVVQI